MLFKLFSFLVLAFFFFSGCDYFDRIKQDVTEKVREVTGKEPEPEPRISLEEAEEIMRPKPVDISYERNPFHSPVRRVVLPDEAEIEPQLDLSLTGIIFFENKDPAVLINSPDKAFVGRKGDTIEGLRIIEIKSDRVILEKDNKEFLFKIREEE